MNIFLSNFWLYSFRCGKSTLKICKLHETMWCAHLLVGRQEGRKGWWVLWDHCTISDPPQADLAGHRNNQWHRENRTKREVKGKMVVTADKLRVCGKRQVTHSVKGLYVGYDPARCRTEGIFLQLAATIQPWYAFKKVQSHWFHWIVVIIYYVQVFFSLFTCIFPNTRCLKY